MFTKILVILPLVAFTLAEPLPQAAATSTDAGQAAMTSDLGSVPTYNSAALNSQLSQLSAIESILSGAPVLPSSVESAFLAAIPSSVLLNTDTAVACQLAAETPDWYATIPNNIKSALTSYELAYSTWYASNSAALVSAEGTNTAATTAAPAFYCSSGNVVQATGSGTGATTTTSGAGKSTGPGASTGSGSGSGSGTAASATGSKAAAPRATGGVALSLAGVVGVLGVMAVL